MTETIWTNYFVTKLAATGADGHLPASELRAKIESHKGGEAYHCAYDLEARDTFSNYSGLMRPVFAHVWFDFDSHDGGAAAYDDVHKFLKWVNVNDAFVCYSGSKGFHVGLPFGYFALSIGAALEKDLHALAAKLKERYPTLDTTVYNANRKFRALGSKHPKTKLYKIFLGSNIDQPLDVIKELAKERGKLTIPVPEKREPLAVFSDLLIKPSAKVEAQDSIAIDEWRRYRQPRGTEAFSQCGFLSWCRDLPGNVNEPQWYAAASIVGRFENGRAQFHGISKSHPGYSSSATDEKLDQALTVSGPRTCEAIDKLWPGCKSCKHYQKIVSPVVILEADVIPTEATGFYDLIRNGDQIKRVPNYNDILSAFIREKPYKTIADMKTIYRFTGTHYEEYTPIEVREFAEKQFRPAPQEKIRQEFLHKVMANEVGKRNFFTTTTENKINFRTGVLDLQGGLFGKHSPEYGFRGVLPYGYDRSATCPTFEWWISDVMFGDKELIAILQEFMGYVVRGGEYKYHKALWLSGDGRNGKSTFLDVLKALVGTDSYSTLSIKQIIEDKFSRADLDGSLVNVSEETSPEELSDSGPFKNLTGDGDVRGEKKFGSGYKFRNRAKLIMTYNEVPNLRDLSTGMMSRPIIIPWKKDLSDESKQDKTLKARLLAELPGIFNFAFAGWERLEAQVGFSKSEKTTIEMQELRAASCSASQWIGETISFEQLSRADLMETLKPRQMYEAYKLHVGQYAYAENKFYKRINSLPKVAERRRRSENGTEYFSMKFRRSTHPALDF